MGGLWLRDGSQGVARREAEGRQRVWRSFHQVAINGWSIERGVYEISFRGCVFTLFDRFCVTIR